MSSSRTLGRYEIVREIGRGGFATVYQASDSVLGRQIALKLLHPARLEDPQTLARFRAEARITSQLIHPNIVVVFDTGEIDGQYFIAMQYVAGQSLAHTVAERKDDLMPFDGITSLLRQIGPALDYAHANGAIHRDVKPANILMDGRGQAYLSDFGIAKALSTATTTGLSVFGQIIGTPHYFSPEQAEGKTLDGRSDLYSLGVIAYELCTGRVPFQSETLVSLMHRIVYDPPPAPMTLHPRVVEPIAAVLMRALAKNPDDRYGTGQALADAFAGAVQTVREDWLKAHLSAAAALVEKRDFEGAETRVREVLSFDPSHAEAGAALSRVRSDHIEHLLAMADNKVMAAEYDAAMKLAEQVIALEPSNERAAGLKREAHARGQWKSQYDAIAGDLDALLERARKLGQGAPGSDDPKGVFAILERPAVQSPIQMPREHPTPAYSENRALLCVLLLFVVIGLATTYALAGSDVLMPLPNTRAMTPADFSRLPEILSANLAIGISSGIAFASGVALLVLARTRAKSAGTSNSEGGGRN